MTSYKFYGKNANDGKFADYRYIGSASLNTCNDRTRLIDLAESIAGPINGPLIAITDITAPIIVLKV